MRSSRVRRHTAFNVRAPCRREGKITRLASIASLKTRLIAGFDYVEMNMHYRTNVLGGPLQCCCPATWTGYFRDGYCRTTARDRGLHTVCAIMTEEFLEFTASKGNNLRNAIPMLNFPGLEPGDRWCLAVLRWKEAFDAGCAPPVILESSHISALEFVPLEDLQSRAIT